MILLEDATPKTFISFMSQIYSRVVEEEKESL